MKSICVARIHYLAAALAVAGGLGQQGVSAATLALTPVAGQRTNFPEGPQASVMFTVINDNRDPYTITSAIAAITGLLSGDGDDVASNAQAAANQCPLIAAFNVKTQTAGTCNITVTFSTTDTFTSASEDPGDIVTWNLALQVTGRSLTHPSNSPQTASSNMTVGVYDVTLPEPSPVWLMGAGGVLLALGKGRFRRRRLS